MSIPKDVELIYTLKKNSIYICISAYTRLQFHFHERMFDDILKFFIHANSLVYTINIEGYDGPGIRLLKKRACMKNLSMSSNIRS